MAGTKITQLKPGATPSRRYGTFATNVTISFSGIVSLEAFGTHTVTATRSVGRITQLHPGALTGRRYGSFVGRLGVILPSITSAEAVGSLIVLGGTLTISPTGIASAETIGAHTLTSVATVAPPSIDSLEAFGTATVLNAGTIIPISIGAGQKLASWTANIEPDLAGYRLYLRESTSIPYTVKYDVGLTLSPSTPAYVVANLTEGVTYFIAVTSYDTSNNESGFSAEESFVGPAGSRFGTSTLTVEKIIIPPSIASAEVIGSATVVRGNVDIVLPGIASDEAFGTLIISTGALTVNLVGIPGAEAFGDATILRGDVTVVCTAITSGEAVGSPTLFAVQSIFLPSIASAESVGGAQLIEEAGGAHTLILVPIPSEEAFGEPQLDYTIDIQQIPSAEEFGTTSVIYLVEPVAILSQEAFGSPIVTVGETTITLSGIPSAEAFGSIIIFRSTDQLPVDVFEAQDRPFVFKATSIKPTAATVN